MQKPLRSARTGPREPATTPDYRAPLVGEIAEVDAEGRAWVRFAGRLAVPVCARSTLDAPPPPGARGSELAGARVLLLFEDGDPDRPIVAGLLRDALWAEARAEWTLPSEALRDLVVDGRRLTFDAKDEIVLRCGRSVIFLNRDGQILIRGDEVVSRARKTNRIKGGAVSIN